MCGKLLYGCECVKRSEVEPLELEAQSWKTKTKSRMRQGNVDGTGTEVTN